MSVLNSTVRVLLGIVLLMLSFSFDVTFAAADKSRPNIVFIIADDLGWGHVGWQNPKVKTPNLDRLAEKGIELNQHYVAPVCSPTRVALLTGRCWSRFGCNGPVRSEPTSLARAMPPKTETIATALKAKGYRTALVGKWHLGAQLDAGPECYGFDYFYGIRTGGCTPLTHKWLGAGPSVLWREQENIQEEGHITDLFAREATAWVGEESDLPFFLYLSFTAPHVPLQESDQWMDMYGETAPDKSHQLYWAAISHMDAAIGSVLDEIRKKGNMENTLVVFISDNGSPGQRNLMQVRVNKEDYLDVTLPGGNSPFRGKKGDLYEGGIRTPALVFWPAVLQPGACNKPLHVTDWMPTISALVDYKPTHDLKWDGRDVFSIISGTTASPPARTLYTKGGRGVALCSGPWKLIISARGKRQFQLYNIDKDISESKDLAGENPERVRQLKQLSEAESAKDNDAVPRPSRSLRQ